MSPAYNNSSEEICGRPAFSECSILNSQVAAGSERGPRAGRRAAGWHSLGQAQSLSGHATSRRHRVNIANDEKGLTCAPINGISTKRADINKSLQANAWQHAQGSGNLNLCPGAEIFTHPRNLRPGWTLLISSSEDTASGTLCA